MTFSSCRIIKRLWFACALAMGAYLATPAAVNAQGLLSIIEVEDELDDELYLDGVSLTGPSADNPPDFPGGDVDSFDQSPDGTCIVFVLDPPDESGEQVWVMDADGSNKRRVDPSGVIASEALFINNGEQILLSAFDPLGDQPWMMNKDGSNAFKITAFPGFDYVNLKVRPGHPASNQRQHESEEPEFQGDECPEEHPHCHDDDDDDGEDLRPEPRRQFTGPTINIFLWSPLFGYYRLLPGFSVDNFDGTWSPDGSRISFTMGSGDDTTIGVVGTFGNGFMALSSGPGDSNSAWLDNDTILFESTRDGNSEIYSINADGSDETNLSNNPADDTNPVGPQGDALALKAAPFLVERAQAAGQILFLSNRNGNQDIFAMNLDGTGQMALTNTPGDETQQRYVIPPPPADPPAINPGGIVLSTLLPTVNTISPLSIISIFGQNLSADTILFPTLDVNGDLDRILGTTCLEMNGERLPIFAVTPGQINAQASAAQVLGPASFTVITDCDTVTAVASETVRLTLEGPSPQEATSNSEMATVEAATPGFFLFPPLANDGLIAARFNSDNAAVAPDGMFSDQFGPSRPAKPGDIIVLYGTG